MILEEENKEAFERLKSICSTIIKTIFNEIQTHFPEQCNAHESYAALNTEGLGTYMKICEMITGQFIVFMLYNQFSSNLLEAFTQSLTTRVNITLTELKEQKNAGLH